MPRTAFRSLPDSARLWVFACDPVPPDGVQARLLEAADDFLDHWQAHGNPLTCARDWRDDRFLAIAVDQSTAGASGCSIDGLFRTLRSLESAIGSRIVGGGSVFFRAPDGSVACVSRDDFSAMAERGETSRSTMVFDTSITTARDWREKFEMPVGESWHSVLLPDDADKT
jgi:hypothetical protein